MSSSQKKNKKKTRKSLNSLTEEMQGHKAVSDTKHGTRIEKEISEISSKEAIYFPD